MKKPLVLTATACALALASLACDVNQTSLVQPSSIRPSSPQPTVQSTDGPVSQPTARPVSSFGSLCHTGGQTTATWTSAQLASVAIRWIDSNYVYSQDVVFTVKKKPFGSVSVSTPTGAVQAEASFYDSSGAEIEGLPGTDCSS